MNYIYYCLRWTPSTCMLNSTHLLYLAALPLIMCFPVFQTVKNPPAMQETWFQSLGLEDPLEEDMATHCSILAWRISWIGESGRLQSMRSQGVGHYWATNTSLSPLIIPLFFRSILSLSTGHSYQYGTVISVISSTFDPSSLKTTTSP